MRERRYIQIFEQRKYELFNPIQTQVFSTLFNTDDSVFVAGPVGCGKTACAEIALMRMFYIFAQQAQSATPNPKLGEERAVYVHPKAEVAELRYKQWKENFTPLGKNVVLLTGDTNTDLKHIAKVSIKLHLL